jgi:multisubunit Na+/H+ antiporter MnhF subunit
MALAFLMTGPTASQLSDYQGVVGAHAVGVDDGGAGLPLLGWSTTGGDLRIPHFVGMHALQGLPLLAFALARLGTRVRLLGDATLRLRLVALAALAWSALVALTCWQALRGQSIVAPDALTLAVGGAVVLALVIAGVVAVRRASAEVAR